jgi:hypothetical protein
VDFIITGSPNDEGLSQLIDSLTRHIIEHELYKKDPTVPEAALGELKMIQDGSFKRDRSK